MGAARFNAGSAAGCWCGWVLSCLLLSALVGECWLGTAVVLLWSTWLAALLLQLNHRAQSPAPVHAAWWGGLVGCCKVQSWLCSLVLVWLGAELPAVCTGGCVLVGHCSSSSVEHRAGCTALAARPPCTQPCPRACSMVGGSSWVLQGSILALQLGAGVVGC